MSVLASIRSLVRSDEDLATLALAHVLDTSPRAAKAMNALLAVDPASRWRPQASQNAEGNGQPRPDLAAYSRSNAAAFIEAKFDAGLTENQPVEYLRRLSKDGHLAMLVPQGRVGYVGAEIVRRCKMVDFAVEHFEHGWDVATDVGARRMSVVTWDTLIRHLLDETRHPDARSAHDDLMQIAALVSEVQDRLFKPLGADELTSGEIPRQLSQMIGLFADLRDSLTPYGFRSYGKHATHVDGKQNIGIARDDLAVPWLLNLDFQAWETTAPTPFWLAHHWTVRVERDRLLEPLLEGAPPAAYRFSSWNTNGIGIPLYVKSEADRAEVLDWLTSQCVAWIEHVEHGAAHPPARPSA